MSIYQPVALLVRLCLSVIDCISLLQGQTFPVQRISSTSFVYLMLGKLPLKYPKLSHHLKQTNKQTQDQPKLVDNQRKQ